MAGVLNDVGCFTECGSNWYDERSHRKMCWIFNHPPKPRAIPLSSVQPGPVAYGTAACTICFWPVDKSVFPLVVCCVSFERDIISRSLSNAGMNWLQKKKKKKGSRALICMQKCNKMVVQPRANVTSLFSRTTNGFTFYLESTTSKKKKKKQTVRTWCSPPAIQTPWCSCYWNVHLTSLTCSCNTVRAIFSFPPCRLSVGCCCAAAVTVQLCEHILEHVVRPHIWVWGMGVREHSG